MRRFGALVAAGALLLVCCASPRNSLGAGSTACFKAIPPAVSEVGRKGSLVGVRQVSAARLAHRYPEFARFGNENLCLVAFRGNFQPGDFPGSAQAGRYVVVAVDSRRATVVAIYVLDQLPLRFRHPV
ncbi:MAG TPA: hypothetical protein VKL22_02395 [Actinomycetota bacterium]|nr:hypothetical protein [Actinomycetota bacterium]